MDFAEEKIRFHYQTNGTMPQISIPEALQVYGRLADEESKYIYSNRLMFSMTNDWKYIRYILNEFDDTKMIDNLLKINSAGIYIYGAGIAGTRFPLLFPEYNWIGYIDRNKKGEKCNCLPVFGIEICENMPEDCLIIVSNVMGEEQIKRDLMSYGVKENNIICIAEVTRKIANNIYFEAFLDKKRASKGYFIDAGAYDGCDTLHYMKWINQYNAKAEIFEADKENYRKVKQNLIQNEKAIILNKGLSDKSEKCHFASGNGEMSNVSEIGREIAELTALDEILKNKDVSYIKMDIEGYEQKAIQGAKNIIKKQKPILAISIYHKREDIWEIPKIILSINSNYKFYIRHYSLGVVDTVLYAV